MLRIDAGSAFPSASTALRGIDAVSRQAGRGLRSVLSQPETRLHPVLVNGAAGVIVSVSGVPVTVIAFTMAAGVITEIDAIADPDVFRP